MKIEMQDVFFRPYKTSISDGLADFMVAVKAHRLGMPGMGFVLRGSDGLAVVFPNLMIRCMVDIDEDRRHDDFKKAREELSALGMPVVEGHLNVGRRG